MNLSPHQRCECVKCCTKPIQARTSVDNTIQPIPPTDIVGDQPNHWHQEATDIQLDTERSRKHFKCASLYRAGCKTGPPVSLGLRRHLKGSTFGKSLEKSSLSTFPMAVLRAGTSHCQSGATLSKGQCLLPLIIAAKSSLAAL